MSIEHYISPENKSRHEQFEQLDDYDINSPEFQEKLRSSGLSHEMFVLRDGEKQPNLSADKISRIKLTTGRTELWLLNMSQPENVIDTEEYRIESDWLLAELRRMDLRRRTGYKGVWEGTPVTVGRSSLGDRFGYLQDDRTMSRKHAEVLLKDGLISIGDKESVNGTRVDVFSYQDNPESEHDVETLDDNTDLADFSEFIRDNQQDLEQFYHGKILDHHSLMKYIYSNFYAKGEEAQPGRELTEAQRAVYSAQIERNLTQLEQARSGIANRSNGYWSYYRVNGGLRTDEIDRVYLNLEPTSCPDIQLELVQRCHEAGISLDTKIPARMDQKAASRADKMVVYVGRDQLSEAKRVIETIYREREADFLNATPRFTEEVKDKDGRVMRGVAFGEEPLETGVESFGGLRSKILANLYDYARGGGMEVDFADQNIVNKFRQLCEKEGVDYKNFARNLPQNKQR